MHSATHIYLIDKKVQSPNYWILLLIMHLKWSVHRSV